MTTILIPTNNRPGFLLRALDSIGRQTVMTKIEKVIVSENGGCIESGQVCEQMMDEHKLPIQWVLRDDKTSASEHGRLIFRDHRNFCNTEFTAILHDDDWWRADHLANGLYSLKHNPGASFYGSNHFDVHGEQSLLYCSSNMFGWFTADFPLLTSAWVIPGEKLILAQILGLICHYSSMIVRTDALKQSTPLFEEPGSEYDNDRMLQFRLGQLGSVVYNPIPEIFIRQHDNRDCLLNFPEDERTSHMRRTTRWIVNKSGLPAKSILQLFLRGFELCPENAKREAIDLAKREWVIPELNRMAKEESKNS